MFTVYSVFDMPWDIPTDTKISIVCGTCHAKGYLEFPSEMNSGKEDGFHWASQHEDPFYRDPLVAHGEWHANWEVRILNSAREILADMARS